jgi:hypothetical protein
MNGKGKPTNDLISRQAAIEAVKKHYRTHDNDLLELIALHGRCIRYGRRSQ